jgi:hypothetical protein
LDYHRTRGGKAAHGLALVTLAAQFPTEEHLEDAYGELVEAALLEPVDETATFLPRDGGQRMVRTLYRLK